MKKSLLSLLLALIMCLSLFATGCANSTEEDKDKDVIKTDTNDDAVTLTLYAPTKSTTTQKEIEVVQAAFNNITQSKFNANVILKLIPEDDYEKTITDMIAKVEQQLADEEAAEQSRLEAEREAALKGETLPDNKNTEDTAKTDSSDTPEIKYPEEKENQLDIFLVQSLETYYELATNQKIAPLDDDIAGGSKLLNSYVYPYLLRAAKVDGSTYGIFNNTVFGSYQYLLLRKELVDKYEYDPEKMKDISTISMFLKEVQANEPDVIPFLGEMEAPVVYWNNQESLIGAFVGSAMSSSGTVDATSYRPEALTPSNLLGTTAYREWYTEYNELYQANCIVEKTEENKNSKYAATIIDGDVTLSPTFASTYNNYKTDEFGFKYITDENGVDYYVSVYKRPMADNDNVFNAGYVINAHMEPERVSRCMNIITALNTDSQLANIFMYGVEGVHYTIDETTKLIHKTTDNYAMNIEHVGNIYLINPSDDMSEYWSFMSANNWENAKNTNREAIMNPFLGFYFNPEKPVEDDLTDEQIFVDMTFNEVYAEIINISKPYLTNIKIFRDSEDTDFAKFLQTSRGTLGEDIMFETVTDYSKGIYHMPSRYNEWYQKHYNVSLD